MPVISRTVRSGSLQGYIVYPPIYGIPQGNTGFPEASVFLQSTLVKGDARARPQVLDMSANTGLSYSHTRIRQDMGVLKSVNPLDPVYFGPLEPVCGSAPHIETSSNLHRRVALDLLNKIGDKSASVVQNLAEGRKTMETAVSLVRYLRDFKKTVPRTLWQWFATNQIRSLTGRTVVDKRGRHYRRVGKRWRQIPPHQLYQSQRESAFSKDAASLLLTFDYGVRPLIMDMYKAAETLGFKTTTPQKYYVSSSAREDDRDTINVTNGTYGASRPFTCERYMETSVRMVAEIQVSNVQNRTLAQFGFTNPIALGWELIPFSHVVDLMFPVGKWLSSIDALKGVGGSYATGTQTFQSLTFEPVFGGGYAQREILSKVRSAPQPVSSLYGSSFGFPSYKPSTSLRSLLDQIATLKILKG